MKNPIIGFCRVKDVKYNQFERDGDASGGAMYEMDWDENEQPDTNVADELLASAEEAVGIINGTVKPGKVWVPPVVTEEHPVDF